MVREFGAKRPHVNDTSAKAARISLTFLSCIEFGVALPLNDDRGGKIGGSEKIDG
jgi:hypothetical protein